MEAKNWTNLYMKEEIPYPSEYVIRIFKGKYPRLNFREQGFAGKSILDIGCGVGRDFPIFKDCGFDDIAGCEISEEIVEKAKDITNRNGILADIRVGNNSNTGFEEERFDYLLSWNVCYYLDEKMDFDAHVKEYARVLKKDGVLIFSIPKKDSFIYKDAKIYKKGYFEIKNDPFKVRNGSVQRYFENVEEIEQVFGKYFKDFEFGSIEDDCFGLDYRWHIGYCRKK